MLTQVFGGNYLWMQVKLLSFIVCSSLPPVLKPAQKDAQGNSCWVISSQYQTFPQLFKSTQWERTLWPATFWGRWKNVNKGFKTEGCAITACGHSTADHVNNSSLFFSLPYSLWQKPAISTRQGKSICMCQKKFHIHTHDAFSGLFENTTLTTTRLTCCN